MPNDVRLERITRAGIELMREERDLALAGRLEALEELNERKAAFLEQLEALAETMTTTGPLQLRAERKAELETLFDIIRRRAEENQYLLKAARAGLRSAQRQLEEPDALGAYAPDGAPVASATRDGNTSQVF